DYCFTLFADYRPHGRYRLPSIATVLDFANGGRLSGPSRVGSRRGPGLRLTAPADLLPADRGVAGGFGRPPPSPPSTGRGPAGQGGGTAWPTDERARCDTGP